MNYFFFKSLLKFLFKWSQKRFSKTIWIKLKEIRMILYSQLEFVVCTVKVLTSVTKHNHKSHQIKEPTKPKFIEKETKLNYSEAIKQFGNSWLELLRVNESLNGDFGAVESPLLQPYKRETDSLKCTRHYTSLGVHNCHVRTKGPIVGPFILYTD